MNRVHAEALALTLGIYLAMGVSFYGWGLVCLRILCIDRENKLSPTLVVWMGWFLSTFLLQLVHFFLALKAWVVIGVWAPGIVIGLPDAIRILRKASGWPEPRRLAVAAVLLAIATVVAVWVASRGMLTPILYDSGLYHFNKIRWINSYPIVPGLANLHNRLGFNHSFFTYSASLNFFPYFGYGHAIANSFLFLLTAASLVDLSRPVLSRGVRWADVDPLRLVPVAAAVPMLFYFAVTAPGMASPSPDLPIALIQIILFVVLAQALAKWKEGEVFQPGQAGFLGVMAVGAVTLKSSALGFSAGIWCFVLLHSLQSRAKPTARRLAIVTALVATVWCVQNAILSGALFFPSTFGRLDLAWSVPTGQILETENWIWSWARWPGRHWSKVLGNWDWVGSWFGAFSGMRSYPIACAVAVLFLILVGASFLDRRKVRLSWAEWSLGLPVVAGLCFWFFTAPDPRFAEGPLFLFPAWALLLFLGLERQRSPRGRYMVIACLSFCLASFHFFWDPNAMFERYYGVARAGWFPIPTAELVERRTDSGLTIYAPKSGNQCWDSPLPSTAYLDSRLRFRDPKDLGSGFIISEGEE